METNSTSISFVGGQTIQSTNSDTMMVNGQWMISDDVNDVDWYILATGVGNAVLNVWIPDMYEFCSSELTCNCKMSKCDYH